MSPLVEVEIASDFWAALGDAEALARDAIEAAVKTARVQLRAGAEVSLQLTDDAAIKALNARWRGQDKATNVLSFPAAPPERVGKALLLGDIVIAFETMRREAGDEGKTLSDHYRHLVVHGFLHLLGYDHQDSVEAERMEALEQENSGETLDRRPLCADGACGQLTMTDEPRGETPAQDRSPGLLERLRGLFGLDTGSVRDDIEDALEGDGDSVDFTPQERTILKNVLGLHDVRLADVMVPRADVIAIQIDAPLSEVLALFRAAGHSRFPVYGETLDDPRGMIHIRDFLDYLAGAPALGLAPAGGGGKSAGEPPIDMSLPLGRANILRPVLYAPPSMPALDLLVRMQASRTHMALVIDEYGGADGLVSMEDVVEAIVGDIEDEHDESETPSIEPTPDGAFIADAKASLEDVSKALGVDLSALADAEDAETIAGLITARAGRVPGRGEIIVGIGDYEFEILDADPRRVKRVKIHPIAGSEKRAAARKRRPATIAGNDATE